MTRFLLATLALSVCANLAGDTSLRIAVASNFHDTLAKIALSYQDVGHDIKITLVPGSSGALFAQISNGAPFDAFFSADRERPETLERNGIAQTDSRFIFALGILALWQPGNTSPDLSQSRVLAMANPQLAPFGKASAETLEALQISPSHPKRVLGTNVSQAFTFARTGAADSAFVSLSQLIQVEIDPDEYLIVDTSLHGPIEQQAVAISDSESMLNFLRYCRTERARTIIEADGYRLPQN